MQGRWLVQVICSAIVTKVKILSPKRDLTSPKDSGRMTRSDNKRTCKDLTRSTAGDRSLAEMHVACLC